MVYNHGKLTSTAALQHWRYGRSPSGTSCTADIMDIVAPYRDLLFNAYARAWALQLVSIWLNTVAKSTPSCHAI